MKVQWLSAALDEYEAATHYLIANAGVTSARQFAAQVKDCVRRLREFPMIGTPVAGRRARRFALHGHPYFLIYRVHVDHLSIVALAHQRRRPGYWAKRR